MIAVDTELYNNLLNAYPTYLPSMPKVHLPSGTYGQFLCRVTSVSDTIRTSMADIKENYFNKNGGLKLSFIGIHDIDNVRISWREYHTCMRSMILVGPVLGGKLRSFVKILREFRTIESLNLAKPYLQMYVDGDLLQSTNFLHD